MSFRKGWLGDFCIAARALRGNPAFALATVATVALGIGTSTAIFSVAYGVNFRPLPYASPRSLVRIYESNTLTKETRHPVSQATFQRWRETLQSLDGIALFSKATTRFMPGEPAVPLTVMSVSPQFFDVLGVAPTYGRTFRAEIEYAPSTRNEVIISYAMWQRHFGSDTAAVGRTLQLSQGDRLMTVVGIMPQGFSFGESTDVWRPEIVNLPIPRVVRGWRYDHVVARLRPSRSLQQLRAELDVASSGLAVDFPQTNVGWQATAESLRDAVSGRFGSASWLFLSAVGALLLVSTTNVAGLLSAQAMIRERSTCIRILLGARRWDLWRSWLLETLLLSAAGTAVGVVWASWFVDVLRATAPQGIPRINEVAVDLPPLLMATCATIAMSIVSASVVAITHGRTRSPTLRDGFGRDHGMTRTNRLLSNALVVAQSTAAIVLVALAAVFARGFVRLASIDLGWNPHGVLALQASPRMAVDNRRPWFLYDQWAERVVTRLESVPGIVRAAVTTGIPFGADLLPADIAVGSTATTNEVRRPMTLHIVTNGYFETLGLSLKRGRLFGQQDRFGEETLAGANAWGSGVAVVTESIAKTLWPGEEPIGRHFRIPGLDRAPFREIVGVVSDVQYTSVGEDRSQHVFIPWGQGPSAAPRLVVRADHDAVAITSAVRSAILEEDSGTGIDRITILSQSVDQSLAPVRLSGQLLAALSAVVLILVGAGVYGSLSMLVNARRREIAVRITLGASAFETLARTLAYGLAPVAVGIVAGILAAIPSIAGARHLQYGVDQLSVGPLLLGAIVVLGCTTVASLVPALRASRTDPILTLRCD